MATDLTGKHGDFWHFRLEANKELHCRRWVFLSRSRR